MIIYVIRVIQNPIGNSPSVNYITCESLGMYKTEKNLHCEVVDTIECEPDELEEELVYINQDINSGAYDEVEINEIPLL